MRKGILFITLVILLFGSVGCSDSQGNTDKIPENNVLENDKVKPEYQEAFEKMCGYLELRYQFPYIQPGMAEKEYLKKKREMEEHLAEINTLPELYCYLQGFVAQFNDMHTSIMVDYGDETVGSEFYFLPCTFKQFQGKWYLMECEEKRKEYLGWELVSINDVGIKELYKKIAGFVSSENTYWPNALMSSTLVSTDVLKYLQIAKNAQDSVEITLKCRDSKQEKVMEVLPVNYAERSTMKFEKLKQDGNLVAESKRNYQAFFIRDEVYFIQINQCYADPNSPIHDFENQVIDDIQKQKPEKIIIDLRNNTGGNMYFSDGLVDRLAMEKVQDVSKIYTLVGNKTASAAVMTAIRLKNDLRCRIVGEPTGGKPNFNSGISSRPLGQLPLSINYSTEYITMVDDDELMSLEPDIYVEQTLDDWQKGEDTVLNYVLEEK